MASSVTDSPFLLSGYFFIGSSLVGRCTIVRNTVSKYDANQLVILHDEALLDSFRGRFRTKTLKLVWSSYDVTTAYFLRDYSRRSERCPPRLTLSYVFLN